MSLYSSYKSAAGVSSVVAGAGIAVSTATGAITVTNTGVRSLSSGTEYSVTTATGAVSLVISSTLDNVVGRGNSTTSTIFINNYTESTDTSTGALHVLGGVGIGGSVYATAIYDAGARVLTTSTINSISLKNTNIITGLYVTADSLDSANSSTITLSSTVPIGYSSFTIRNTGASGQSYTVDVGGNNRALTGGTAVDEGNFTLKDDTNNAYRFIVTKSGNILVNTTTDTGAKLQVNGSVSISGNTLINTTTDTGAKLQVNGSVSIASSLIETTVTLVNTTSTTEVDRFVSSVYRSCKSFVQVQDGADFHISEIVVLHDTSGQVYKSEYGIISTGGEKGTFTADLQLDGIVRLYFTADTASNKTISIIKTVLAI